MMMIKDVLKKSNQLETIQVTKVLKQCRAILLYNYKLQFSYCSHIYVAIYYFTQKTEITKSLHIACMKSNFHAVVELLISGADLNSKDNVRNE